MWVIKMIKFVNRDGEEVEISEQDKKFAEFYRKTYDAVASARAAGFDFPEDWGPRLAFKEVICQYIQILLTHDLHIRGGCLGVDQMINLAQNAENEQVKLYAAVRLADWAGVAGWPQGYMEE